MTKQELKEYQRQYHANYYKKHKLELDAYRKQWIKDHPDHTKSYWKQHYKDHKQDRANIIEKYREKEAVLDLITKLEAVL
jgi:hypothetical protein